MMEKLYGVCEVETGERQTLFCLRKAVSSRKLHSLEAVNTVGDWFNICDCACSYGWLTHDTATEDVFRITKRFEDEYREWLQQQVYVWFKAPAYRPPNAGNLFLIGN
ncbi:MAG: hypothetical protein LW878_04945, partial [Proteobacteria bacterium]|nr:hypothetical protein [Pseudomonadota bacterium]